VEITGYVGGRTYVRIPPFIGGLPVTAIGEYAFVCTEWAHEWIFSGSLASVAIPSGITHIGKRAFAYNPL